MDKWYMKWNEFDNNIRDYLRILRDDQRLFDVTLVTDDGQHIQAHKIILSAGSNFFSDIFLKSNQTNMLIYLKGINSVQLEHHLDFIYNEEASIGQDEVKEFIETGKNLKLKGFEAYVFNIPGEQKTVVKENDEVHENGENITEDTLDPLMENYFSSEDALTLKDEDKSQINTNIERDIQISEMIKATVCVWKCKVCGKTSPNNGHMREHAESHIEGLSYTCHICNKNLSSRHSLRCHINDIHSVRTCDICGKSGMSKSAFFKHKARLHKTLSDTV